jgi:cephalosporin hydroxylase
VAEESSIERHESAPAAVRETYRLPPDISIEPAEDLGAYWRERLRQHTGDSYAGLRLSKLPEDLRTYEHLLWSDKPDTVVELGTQYGASALWFRDRLRTLQSYGLIDEPRVVTLDIDQSLARRELPRADPGYEETIHVLEGDVRDLAMADQVRQLVGKRCFIIEDSAHEYETTYAALTMFSDLVPPGGYFIVEDGSVDIDALRVAEDWPRGVLPALRDWLRTPGAREFYVRRDLELYGITGHPNGFLQRQVDNSGVEQQNSSHDRAVIDDECGLLRPGLGSMAERELAAEIDRLRNEIAALEERLAETDRLQDLLVDAERRLADVPDLQLRLAELERERDEARRAADRAHDEARVLDVRLSVGEQVLANVLSSPSWRVTKPLRTAKHALGPHLDRLRRQ